MVSNANSDQILGQISKHNRQQQDLAQLKQGSRDCLAETRAIIAQTSRLLAEANQLCAESKKRLAQAR